MSLNFKKPSTTPDHIATAGEDVEVTLRVKVLGAPKIQISYGIPAPFSVDNGRHSKTKTFTVPTNAAGEPVEQYRGYKQTLAIENQSGQEMAALLIGLKVKEKGGIFGDGDFEEAPPARVTVIAGMRKKKGVTQAKLAEATGLSVSTISKAERGERVSEKSRGLIEEHLKKIKG